MKMAGAAFFSGMKKDLSKDTWRHGHHCATFNTQTLGLKQHKIVLG
jgi:hypothetical protein